MIKKILKKRLSVSQRRKLRNTIADITSVFCSRDLNILGKLYGTDKIGIHSYAGHYMEHFKSLRRKKINLFEIGVGGYEDPKAGGNSLKMWKQYFPFAKIYSLDIYDKSPLEEKRIKIFKGSQIDEKLLDNIFKEIGLVDVIIDDGSHINQHVIETFKFLFPKLKDGGIYVIEDTQTSYWPNYGGDNKDLSNQKTMMNYFKSLTDSLNYQEFEISNYEPTYFDTKISSIHFYHNLIFIYK